MRIFSLIYLHNVKRKAIFTVYNQYLLIYEIIIIDKTWHNKLYDLKGYKYCIRALVLEQKQSGTFYYFKKGFRIFIFPIIKVIGSDKVQPGKVIKFK